MMSTKEQFRQAVIEAPKAILRVPSKCWVVACFYVAACSLICLAVSVLLVSNEGQLWDSFLHTMFPDDWHFVVRKLGYFFFESQSTQVLINMAVAGSVLLVSILLFPIKEKLSYTYESQGKLSEDEVDPLPLHLEAWEETKLVCLYAAMMMSIFWVGYHPDPWRKDLAAFLSTCLVALTFAIDFISPTLFRHRMRYTTVFKTLFLHPVATLGFGFLFATPPLLAGWLLDQFGVTSWDVILGVLFAAEVVAIVWACIGGTWLAAKMWPQVRTISKPWWGFQLGYWTVLLGILFWNVSAFWAVGQSLYAKTPLFKSRYSVVEGSLDWRGVGLRELWKGEISTGFSLDVSIENPTDTDLVIEKNRIVIEHKNDYLAQTRFQPFEVPAGSTRVQNLGVDVDMPADWKTPGRLAKFLNPDDLHITLYVEVRKGMDFPIYLH